MSSYGERRDRRDEEWNKAFAAQQKGFQNAQSYRRGGRSYTKKQTTMICVSFMSILIVILVVLIVVITES